MHHTDDMLTPCNDEDPEAAISTAPLLGEKDDSMINLSLVRNDETMVSHLTNISPTATIIYIYIYIYVVNSLRLLLHGTRQSMMLMV